MKTASSTAFIAYSSIYPSNNTSFLLSSFFHMVARNNRVVAVSISWTNWPTWKIIAYLKSAWKTRQVCIFIMLCHKMQEIFQQPSLSTRRWTIIYHMPKLAATHKILRKTKSRGKAGKKKLPRVNILIGRLVFIKLHDSLVCQRFITLDFFVIFSRNVFTRVAPLLASRQEHR